MMDSLDNVQFKVMTDSDQFNVMMDSFTVYSLGGLMYDMWDNVPLIS